MLIAPYQRVAAIKQDVNTRQYNKIVMARKLRLAKFIPFPKLVRGFRNRPTLTVVSEVK